MNNITDEVILAYLEKVCEEMGLDFRRASSPEEAGFYYRKNGIRKKMSEEEMRDAIFGPIASNHHDN